MPINSSPIQKPPEILPVLRVPCAALASKVLVVGDAQRAEQAAQRLVGATLVGSNREYVTYTGQFQEQKLAICSHGVGAAGASVCFAELLQAGVRVILRAGTCGALQAEIEDGSLILGLAAVREDGASDQLIPLAYPAYADPGVVHALQQAAAENRAAIYRGVVLTQAHLYPGLLPSTIGLWQQAGAVAVEMEFAVLLVMAHLQGARAGGIFVSDGNLARQQAALSPQTYDPHRAVVAEGVDRMLHVALEALARL